MLVTISRQRYGTLSTIAQWREILRVYPIYAAIAKEFGCGDPPYASLENLPARSEANVIDAVQSWLDQMDERFEPHQFRAVLEKPELATSEDKLRGLIERHLRKRNRTQPDRDKLHYLLTQYAYVCAPPKFRVRITGFSELAEVMEPVLGPVTERPAGPLQALAGLVPLMPRCSTLQAFEASVVIPGRQLKATLGEAGETAAGLLAITHFNYSLRCTYSRLLKDDLRASGESLEKLEAQGVTTVDCTALGLSASEPIEILRECLNELSQVTPADDAVRKARSEQVQALRSTVEAALKVMAAARPQTDERIPAMEAYIQQLMSELGQARAELQSLRRVVEDVAAGRQAERTPVPLGAAPAAAPAPRPAYSPVKPPHDYSLDVQRCREGLRRVLGETPSHSTRAVKMGGATVVLSPGEVEALYSDTVPAAQAHRAITARVLLLSLLDRKQRGEAVAATGVIDFARTTLAEHQRLAESADCPEWLHATARELQSVLQQAEAVFQPAAEHSL